jgi:hypothetical protein
MNSRSFLKFQLGLSAAAVYSVPVRAIDTASATELTDRMHFEKKFLNFSASVLDFLLAGGLSD